MNFIVLDIETSGISPRKSGMLSLGAIDFESGEEFYGECRLTSNREITPIALEINGFKESEILDQNKASDIELYSNFRLWAADKSKVLAGHNVGHFDILFLEEINSRVGNKFPFSYRTVDLHSIAFAKFKESLTHEQICVKLGLLSEPKPHNALLGARSERDALNILLS